MNDKLTETPEQRAYTIGFNEGKSFARNQILMGFIFGAIGWIFGAEILWPWVRSLH